MKRRNQEQIAAGKEECPVFSTQYPVLCARYSIHRQATVWLMLVAAWLTVIPCQAAQAEGGLVTPLGVEGVYYLRWKGPVLEATPVDDDAAVVLRIANVAHDGEDTLYELRYIGARAGRHDLRNSLRRVDGQSLAGLSPILVSVKSRLPENHDGDLDDRAVAGVVRPWRYRLTLAAACLLWAVPLVWIVGGRLLRRRGRQTMLVEEPPRTLADQLRPLVEAAVAGQLSTVQQAQLERMLIAFWRERLDLAGCPMDEALTRLRQHPPSALLLARLDEWFHQRPGRRAVDVAEILRPYRDHAPLDRVLVEETPL